MGRRPGQQLETGTEVGEGVLGAKHIQTQMVAAVTHFLQVSDPLAAHKDQIRWVMRVEMLAWRSEQ